VASAATDVTDSGGRRGVTCVGAGKDGNCSSSGPATAGQVQSAATISGSSVGRAQRGIFSTPLSTGRVLWTVWAHRSWLSPSECATLERGVIDHDNTFGYPGTSPGYPRTAPRRASSGHRNSTRRTACYDAGKSRYEPSIKLPGRGGGITSARQKFITPMIAEGKSVVGPGRRCRVRPVELTPRRGLTCRPPAGATLKIDSATDSDRRPPGVVAHCDARPRARWRASWWCTISLPPGIRRPWIDRLFTGTLPRGAPFFRELRRALSAMRCCGADGRSCVRCPSGSAPGMPGVTYAALTAMISRRAGTGSTERHALPEGQYNSSGRGRRCSQRSFAVR